MEEKLYTITLENGGVIDNLRLNGNNFISQEKITPMIFDGNLGIVTISDGETEDVRKNMELIQLTRIEDEWWFILRDIPESEIKVEKLRSDIDYIAMMADITF